MSLARRRNAKQANPVSARLARWLLTCAVRHWPEETRSWGLALAAEIDETASTFETVSWALGGIVLFARALLSRVWAWMNLPAGASLLGASETEGPSLLPKCSRVSTAAILLVVAVLLFLPMGREAVRTVRASWQGFQESPSDQQTIEKLAARAEKEKDAGTLAFVALSISDPKRATAFTERAVALDPDLIWAYGARNHAGTFDPPRMDWLAQLQAADPGNAVPDLLMAEALAEPRVDKLRAHETLEYAALRAPQWLSLMTRAYNAPRYDSYFQRHYQLTRMVWNRERDLPPSLVLYGLLQRHALPGLRSLNIFAQIKIHEARKARAEKDLTRAASLLGEVDAFGMRMVDGSETSIEKVFGLIVAAEADQELLALYSGAGQTSDAQKIELRLAQIGEQRIAIQRALPPNDSSRAQAFRREAALVQGFGTMSVIAGFAALAGILLLELWPGTTRNTKTIWRRATCWLVDYAPAAMLAASSAFLISFLPFQRVLTNYRSSNYLLVDQGRLADALWALIAIPEFVMDVKTRIAMWSLVTIVLTALLLFVVLRSISRARRAALNPA